MTIRFLPKYFKHMLCVKSLDQTQEELSLGTQLAVFNPVLPVVAVLRVFSVLLGDSCADAAVLSFHSLPAWCWCSSIT